MNKVCVYKNVHRKIGPYARNIRLHFYPLNVIDKWKKENTEYVVTICNHIQNKGITVCSK